jgi:hypothetical protein
MTLLQRYGFLVWQCVRQVHETVVASPLQSAAWPQARNPATGPWVFRTRTDAGTSVTSAFRRDMRKVVTAALAFAVAFSAAAAAQSPDPSASDSSRQQRPALHRGDHLRVAIGTDTATLTGHLVSLDSADIVIAPDDSTAPTRTVPIVALGRFQVERGNTLRLISTGIGAGLGEIAGAAYYQFGWCRGAEQSCARDQREQDLAAEYDQTYYSVGSLFAIAGMIVGGSLGYVIAPAPHWEVVATPTLERDRLGMLRDGLMIGVERQVGW